MAGAHDSRKRLEWIAGEFFTSEGLVWMAGAHNFSKKVTKVKNRIFSKKLRSCLSLFHLFLKI